VKRSGETYQYSAAPIAFVVTLVFFVITRPYVQGIVLQGSKMVSRKFSSNQNQCNIHPTVV